MTDNNYKGHYFKHIMIKIFKFPESRITKLKDELYYMPSHIKSLNPKFLDKDLEKVKISDGE